MVVADNIIVEAMQALESLNLPIPTWVSKVIIVLLFLGMVYEFIIKPFFNLTKNAAKFFQVRRYSPDTKRFIDIRKIFVDHLDSEVKRLNREADWNDFYYTELEAEVEIDPSLNFDARSAKNPIATLRSFWYIVRSFFGTTPTLKVQKNLIQAIRTSNSRAFLVIGDPGSGKTVSLRHLFLEMSKTCASSRHKDAVVPIYLNLKHLNMEPNKLDAERIHEWILEQLSADQDRTIHEFLEINFEKMLKDGNFFFIFDSFDEIPAVMDAQEEQEVVRQYAMALDRFLHSQHPCRGLVSSRPYRAPKTFVGQRMIIRPLSNTRIRNALSKYMGQELMLAAQLWQELIQGREDMLYVAQNPFYLGLLTRYAKENHKLPERHYDLFEHFVQTRAQTDETRLRHFGLTPAELVEQASTLAFAMTRTPHIGLEADFNQIHEITSSIGSHNDIGPLLHALAYSKLGRLSREEPGEPRIFSFVHRRFHEYFCARYLKQNPGITPFENLAADDRWREVLALLCEVLPGEHITKVFDIARSTLLDGMNSDSGSTEHRKAIETIRFLRDGFRSRINDLPIDVRVMCSEFIKKQLRSNNFLDRKRAIEGVILADSGSVHQLLESALISDSAWLRETALSSCRVLPHVPNEIAEAIRKHIYQRYADLKILQDHDLYSVLFSSPPILHPFKSFSTILVVATLFQALFYVGFIFYGLIFDIKISVIFIGGLLLGIFFYFSLFSLGSIFLQIGKPEAHSLHHRILNRIVRNFKQKSINPLLSIHMGIFYSSLFLINFFSIKSSSKIPYIFLPAIFILLNLFLARLVSDYPIGISAWLLYPLKVVAKNISDLLNLLRDRKKFFRTISAVAVMLIVILGSVVWLVKVVEFSKSQGYSIVNIYSAYGLFLSIPVILTILILGIFFLVAIIITSIAFLKTLLNFVNIFRDQIKRKKLSFLSANRPSTATESIKILHSFKSDMGKAQYVKMLFKWLPMGKDPQILIEEANKNQDIVRDDLYKIAEIWEDSCKE